MNLSINLNDYYTNKLSGERFIDDVSNEVIKKLGEADIKQNTEIDNENKKTSESNREMLRKIMGLGKGEN